MILSREQACALANVDPEAYKSLLRQERPRLPQLPPEFKSPGRGHTPLETLALAAASEFVTQYSVARERAADICSAMNWNVVLQHWDAIAVTSRLIPAMRRGLRARDREIFFGRFLIRGERGIKPVPVCGTQEEIARKYPFPVGGITLSMSLIGATIEHRAESWNRDDQGPEINIERFWSEPIPAKRSHA